jgi:glycosyltransferase involved in cell wall biosynthesis
MNAEQPMITIVMPSLNMNRFIRTAMDSVLSQHYPSFELIVTDGGSKDGTLDTLRSYGDRIRWISEKDRGQSDAINKGFRMARGEIYSWLNADDISEPGAFRAIGECFARYPETQWVMSHVSEIDEHGEEINRWVTKYKQWWLRHYSFHTFLVENYISQMGVFMRRSAYEAVGGVDERIQYAMDYDLELRLAKRWNPRLVDRFVARFRLHSASKTVAGVHKTFASDFQIAKNHAGGQRFIVALHWLNNKKIIVAYRAIDVFVALKKIF